ncbi:SDR family oxidoreductase [Planococcus lenghuensis]|uniref:NAD(P)-dependent oxidoreductase n=1 Tax=Planococcus lenghuensis TaxID=2213202 RepID=A0A1Q2L2W9_9BACL|nr:SDR family oxidoreductase [Planococcus lenghuensis]AQQ54781.1 NAD(P)-dependent oxidoreductase [Planococcus lenghuensis]
MTIAITGATGQLGSAVIKYLQEQNSTEKIVAVVRDIEKARAQFEGTDVEVRFGDYDEPVTLPNAFEGADKLLLVSSPSYDDPLRVVQHANAVKAARDAGVGHIFYTSIAFADESKLSLAPLHVATEFAIRTTGIPYTFIRNSLYSDVFINPDLSASVNSGEIVTNTGSGKLNTVTRDDLAKGTAAVLAGEGHENKTYNFVSSTTWTFDELADVLSRVSGKDVKHRNVSFDEQIAYLQQVGLPEGMAVFSASIYDNVANGETARTSTDLKQFIGEETSLEETVRQNLNA